MTIKEFRKEFRSEKKTIEWMFNGETLSYHVVYKTVEELHAKLNKEVKNGKTKTKIKYEIVNFQNKMISKLDKRLGN